METLSEKQIEILQIVENLIAHKGINATSLRLVAKESGINVAMISYYFGSKENMILKLFEYRIGYIHDSLNNIQKDTKLNTIEKLEQYLNIYIEKMFQNGAFHKIMVREYSLMSISDPIKETISHLKLKSIHIVDKIIEDGLIKGEVKNRVAGEYIIALVIGSISYFILNQNMYEKYWQTNGLEGLKKIILKEHMPNLILSIKSILHINEN